MSNSGNRITATRVGECSSCHQLVFMVVGVYGYGILVHNNQHDVRCNGSGMSPRNTLYLIESHEQALNMAELIARDTDVCLDLWMSSTPSNHSMACGDGRRCQAERARRSQALAQYVLQTY